MAVPLASPPRVIVTPGIGLPGVEPLGVRTVPDMKYLPSNEAVTVTALFMITVQFPVPVQPPPFHPVKFESEDAVAIRVTEDPVLNASEQSPPQLIPEGMLVTVPFPLPDFATVRV